VNFIFKYLAAAFAPANLSNWILAIIGIAGGRLAWNTLSTIKKQVDLQAAGIRQWIDVEPVRTEAFGSSLIDNYEVRAMFEAFNNTGYVMTIKKIITKVGIEANTWEVFTVETNVTLPPSKKKSSGYFFYAPIAKMKKEWYESTSLLTVYGEITFEDCMDSTRVQEFSGLYESRPGELL
jgi:hypothetical protein